MTFNTYMPHTVSGESDGTPHSKSFEGRMTINKFKRSEILQDKQISWDPGVLALGFTQEP